MKRSFNFIKNYPLNSLKGLKYFAFKALRVIYLTAKNFTEDKSFTTSSSLTYYTLMALMPIIAIILGIAKTIGYNKLVEQEILLKFPEHHKLILEFIDISNNFLRKMDVDIIAISSVIVLLLAVIVALSHLVSYFNSIWEVNKKRKIKTRYFIYCSLILSILIYFLISIFLNFIIAKKLTFLIHKDYVYFVIGIISFILLISLLTFIYKFIPHTKVKFKSALVGAFFGGILYILWQWMYVKFQVGVNRYDSIYGSLAFIPIFLVWLKFSWIIVLLGSEISYAYQNIEDCEFKNEAAHLSQNYITVLSIWFLKRR